MDTNIIIFWLKGRYGINERIKAAGAENCFVSEVTVAEFLERVAQARLAGDLCVREVYVNSVTARELEHDVMSGRSVIASNGTQTVGMINRPDFVMCIQGTRICRDDQVPDGGVWFAKVWGV